MLTIFFGLAAATAAVALGRLVFSFGPILSFLFGLLGFLLVVIPINLWLRKKMEKIFSAVQNTISQDQEKMRRQLNQLQGRMMGSPRGIQKQMEKQQTTAVRQALKKLEDIDSLRKWNFMAQKQADTLRGQLLYQAKEFEEADQYLRKSLNIDPMTVAMKMARHYQKGEIDKLEKTYKKVRRRFKNEKGIILHCLYAWVLVRQKRSDEALDLLARLKEKTDNQVVRSNWEHLANGRIRNFSNAGLGESWYALHLEQPRATRIKQHGGGKRR